jgi:NADH dehydrogenase
MKTIDTPNIEQQVAAERTVETEPTRYPLAERTPRPSGRPRVVVVGAGFGGLSVVRKLAQADVDVLMLDRNNYHGFWPLLYQVATAGLEPESIAYPARAILRKYPNANFLMADVTDVDFERRLVLTSGGPLAYDYLVLAAGSANNYFGDEALAAQTFGMKDIDDAERLRNQVLRAFEQAVIERDPAKRAALLTFVIVGGGPTGVELAGAFAELIRHVLRKDYPMLDVSQARVLLVEASDRILASFPEPLQRKARKRLEKMGVEVKLRTAVSAVDKGVVSFKDGTSLDSGTVVWAAGVRAADLADALGVPLGRGARVKIRPTLNLPERPEVFVIGDMAYLEGYKNGQSYPMVAPVAIQQGKLAARNILALIEGRPLRTFRYFDRGQMATIGRRAAVMDSFGIHLSGFIAWLGWLFVHLIELIGFRNRLVVLTNWAYNYFTYDRAVRLITGKQE